MVYEFSIQMNSYIKNPKILLLKCSIEYLYREETKFTCIEPIVLQVSESTGAVGFYVAEETCILLHFASLPPSLPSSLPLSLCLAFRSESF